MQTFPVDSSDGVRVSWSPDDAVIAVVDDMLDCNVFIYAPNGKSIAKYSPYDNALGIKVWYGMVWHGV